MKVLTEYAECLEAAPACTQGNEKAATTAATACIRTLVDNSASKLSPACAAGMALH